MAAEASSREIAAKAIVLRTHEIAGKATEEGMDDCLTSECAWALPLAPRAAAPRDDEADMIRIRAPKDFYAGLLFIGIGLLGAVLGSHYAFGSALRMGPGYLPTILSCITMGLGAIVMLRSFAFDGEPVSAVVWRPLILIIGAIVLFGLTITHGGLVLAVVATAIVGGLAARDMGRIELVVLALGLAAFSAGVFVYGLAQPMELWPF